MWKLFDLGFSGRCWVFVFINLFLFAFIAQKSNVCCCGGLQEWCDCFRNIITGVMTLFWTNFASYCSRLFSNRFIALRAHIRWLFPQASTQGSFSHISEGFAFFLSFKMCFWNFGLVGLLPILSYWCRLLRLNHNMNHNVLNKITSITTALSTCQQLQNKT